MISKNRMSSDLKDSNGNVFLLKISATCEDIATENFMPDEPGYPDACRYYIYSYDKKNNMYETVIFEDTEEKDAVVKKLKKIHGITDPWDDDPDYFTKKQEQQKKDVNET